MKLKKDFTVKPRKHLRQKATNFFLTAQAVLLGMMIPGNVAHAQGFGQNVTINQDALNGMNPYALFGSAVGIILGILQLVGIGAVIWGVVSVTQSSPDDPPDKKVKGISSLGAGVVLIALKFVLQAMGIIV